MSKQSLKTILGRASFKNRDRYDLEKHINGAYDKVKEFIGDNPDFDSLQKVVNAIDDTNLVQIGDYDAKLIANTIELIGRTNVELSKTVGTVFIKNDSVIGESSRGNILKVARNPNNKNSIIVDIFSGGNYNKLVERIITYTFTLSGNTITYTNDKVLNIGDVELITKIDYLSLKHLQENSLLVPGKKYRITDYDCYVSNNATDFISARHPFDIIITAISENSFCEKCSAIQHEGDTYFKNNKLNKWEIWYDMCPNSDKYEWCQDLIEENIDFSKGIIYRMIDEYGNECPYDFKNIKFKNPLNTSDTNYYYTFNAGIETDISLTIGCTNNIIKPYNKKLNRIMFYSEGNDVSNNYIGHNCRNILISNSNSVRLGNDCYNIKITEGSLVTGNGCRDIILFYSFITLGNYCTNCNFLSCNNIYVGNNSQVIAEENCNNICIGNYCIVELPTNVQFSVIEDNCRYIKLLNIYTYIFNNYHIVKGTSGTQSNPLEIELISNTGETKVAKNSDGELKIYCEADLIK